MQRLTVIRYITHHQKPRCYSTVKPTHTSTLTFADDTHSHIYYWPLISWEQVIWLSCIFTSTVWLCVSCECNLKYATELWGEKTTLHLHDLVIEEPSDYFEMEFFFAIAHTFNWSGFWQMAALTFEIDFVFWFFFIKLSASRTILHIVFNLFSFFFLAIIFSRIMFAAKYKTFVYLMIMNSL